MYEEWPWEGGGEVRGAGYGAAARRWEDRPTEAIEGCWRNERMGKRMEEEGRGKRRRAELRGRGGKGKEGEESHLR